MYFATDCPNSFLKNMTSLLCEQNAASASAEDFLTLPEAMAILKVKRTRMYELLQSGTIKASKLGRLWRIERASLNEFIRGCRK